MDYCINSSRKNVVFKQPWLKICANYPFFSLSLTRPPLQPVLTLIIVSSWSSSTCLTTWHHRFMYSHRFRRSHARAMLVSTFWQLHRSRHDQASPFMNDFPQTQRRLRIQNKKKSNYRMIIDLISFHVIMPLWCIGFTFSLALSSLYPPRSMSASKKVCLRIDWWKLISVRSPLSLR